MLSTASSCLHLTEYKLNRFYVNLRSLLNTSKYDGADNRLKAQGKFYSTECSGAYNDYKSITSLQNAQEMMSLNLPRIMVECCSIVAHTMC